MFYQQVGDGTTSVVLLAGEFLKQAKPFIEEGVHPQIIIKAFRRAAFLVSSKITNFAVILPNTMFSVYRAYNIRLEWEYVYNVEYVQPS